MANDWEPRSRRPGFNNIAWFEIGSANLSGVRKFYGDIFGWDFGFDESDGYQIITTGDEGPGLRSGSLRDTKGEFPEYAVFGVFVEDVADVVRRVVAMGGRIRRGPEVTAAGVTFAQLLDPAGRQFEVFSTPPFAA